MKFGVDRLLSDPALRAPLKAVHSATRAYGTRRRRLVISIHRNCTR